MKIFIGVSRNNKIGSKAIQWWIGANYSHSYVRWTLSTQERDIIYQASHGMVHFISLENFTKENEIVEEIELELCPESFKRFSRKCVDLAGVEYSTLELFQILLHDMSKGRITFEDQHGYICSELICDLLEDLGIKFSKPKFMMNPKDIMECLKKLRSI
jgi:hypothetical protein